MFSGFSMFFRWTKLDILAFAIAVPIFGGLAVMVFDRTPPIELQGWQVFPKEVKPGETVYREIRVKRTRICKTDPDTIIIDGARVRWHFEEPAIAAPGHIGIDTYRRPVIIPLQASPGAAEMRTSSTFYCNPLHNIWPIRVVFEPLRFTILAH